MRVLVIGGGVMGCATALSLASRGAEVIVLERSVPGAEASSAAAGILGAQVEAHAPGPLSDTLLAGRDAYPAWAEELRAATGIDVGYKRCGVLKVAMHEVEGHALAELVAWQGRAGMRAELLSDREARVVEPALSDGVRSAAYFADDAQVDPRQLLRALVTAVSKLPKVIVQSGASVRSLIVVADRCVGVRTEEAELSADAVVLAAGSWSSLVPGVPASVEVRPVRGQIVQLEERPPSVRTIVFGAGGYVVPRGDGRVLCGSTMERVGFRREVTAGGVAGVLGSAIALCPRLAEAQVDLMWSSFRPESTSGGPMIGASSLAGLFLATGHHRNGILLARHTAELVASAVLGG
jgi:glycine oxidase